MVFIQTAEMLDLYKRNSEPGAMIHVVEGNSNYGMNKILINGVDQTVGNILTFAVGLYSAGSDKTAFRWFLDKFNDKCSVLRKPLKNITCEINEELLAAIKKKCK